MPGPARSPRDGPGSEQAQASPGGARFWVLPPARAARPRGGRRVPAARDLGSGCAAHGPGADTASTWKGTGPGWGTEGRATAAHARAGSGQGALRAPGPVGGWGARAARGALQEGGARSAWGRVPRRAGRPRAPRLRSPGLRPLRGHRTGLPGPMSRAPQTSRPFRGLLAGRGRRPESGPAVPATWQARGAGRSHAALDSKSQERTSRARNRRPARTHRAPEFRRCGPLGVTGLGASRGAGGGRGARGGGGDRLGWGPGAAPTPTIRRGSPRRGRGRRRRVPAPRGGAGADREVRAPDPSRFRTALRVGGTPSGSAAWPGRSPRLWGRGSPATTPPLGSMDPTQ